MVFGHKRNGEFTFYHWWIVRVETYDHVYILKRVPSLKEIDVAMPDFS